MAKSVKLLLIIAHILQILAVSSLTSEEFLDDLLNIRLASLGTNVLESLFNLGSSVHLLLHLALEEAAPELLGKQVLVHLEFVGVLVVVGGLVADLLLASVALDASLQGSLLVVKRLQHGGEPILSLEMVLVNQSHQFLQSVLSLEALLLGLSVLVTLLLEDSLLVLVAILGLIETDLDSDQILLHAVNHVLVAALHHHLVLVGVLDPIQGLSRVLQAIGLPEDGVFD